MAALCINNKSCLLIVINIPVENNKFCFFITTNSAAMVIYIWNNKFYYYDLYRRFFYGK